MARRKMPSPAMLIAIAALIVALSGTAIAATKIGIDDLGKKAKKQTVGVGPLTYVTVPVSVPPTGPAGFDVAAACPSGLRPLGGGIRLSNDVVMFVNDSYLTTSGLAGTVFNFANVAHAASVTVSCASSRDVEGVAPAFSARSERESSGGVKQAKKD